MRRAIRNALSACLLPVIAAGAAYAWFIRYPTPPIPQLSALPQRDSIRVGGFTREFIAYVPRKRAVAPPLVIALHGAFITAEQMRLATGYRFDSLADEHGFVVVYPEGHKRNWNDCRKDADFESRRLGIDDVAFIRALVREFHVRHGIDTASVFVLGYSNGGHLALRLALEAPELVRAVAVVAANLPTDENLACTPVPGTTPVLFINGTEDPINPYHGGRVSIFGFSNRGHVRSAPASGTVLATRNGITDPPVIEHLRQQVGEKVSATRTSWRSTDGADVVLYTIEGGGHTIPLRSGRFPRILGRTPRVFDGPEEIWRFFVSYRAAPSQGGSHAPADQDPEVEIRIEQVRFEDKRVLLIGSITNTGSVP